MRDLDLYLYLSDPLNEVPSDHLVESFAQLLQKLDLERFLFLFSQKPEPAILDNLAPLFTAIPIHSLTLNMFEVVAFVQAQRSFPPIKSLKILCSSNMEKAFKQMAANDSVQKPILSHLEFFNADPKHFFAFDDAMVLFCKPSAETLRSISFEKFYFNKNSAMNL